MKSRLLTYIFPLVLSLIAGCGSTRKLAPPAREAPPVSREAVNYIINGAIADILDRPKDALVEYHQAAEIDTSSPGIYLALAENYFLLKNYQTTVRLLRKAIRIDPGNIEALELLATCYEKLRRFRHARLVYQRMSELRPNNIEFLYNLTSLQILTRQFNSGLRTYKTLVKRGFDDPDFRIRIGQMFLQSRAVDQAEEVFLDIYREHPDLEAVYLALAAAGKISGDSSAAVSWYRRALSVNPRFEDAKAELRVIFEKDKNWNEAIGTYHDLVQRDSTNLADRIQLGQYQFLSGDTLEATLTFSSAVEQHPWSERTHLALAAIYKIRGDTLEAEQVYQRALDQRADFHDVRRNLRDIYAGRGQWREAIGLYQPLTEADSTQIGAHLEIVNLLFQKGDTLEAISRCDSLLRRNEQDWRVAVTLGRLYFATDQNHRAVEPLRIARQNRDDLSHLYVLSGINFMQMDSLDLALEVFEEAVKKFPDEPEINYYVGSILSRNRQFREAIPYLEKSREAEPENIQTLLALAGAYDEVFQHENSADLYEKLVRIDPDSPIILNNYAYHLSLRGIRLEEALEMVKKALVADPDNSPYLDTIGWIYYQTGEYQLAREYIEKSLQIRDDSPEVWEHLGEVYLKMGEPDKARQSWRRAIDLDSTRSHLMQKLEIESP